MAQSFGAWLKRQADRNDPVGDLAQDFLCACKWRKEDPDEMTRDSIHFQMGCLGAGLDAYRALAKASKEWQSAR